MTLIKNILCWCATFSSSCNLSTWSQMSQSQVLRALVGSFSEFENALRYKHVFWVLEKFRLSLQYDILSSAKYFSFDGLFSLWNSQETQIEFLVSKSRLTINIKY